MDTRRWLVLLVLLIIVIFTMGCVASKEVTRPTLPEDCVGVERAVCKDYMGELRIPAVDQSCVENEEFVGVFQGEYCYDAKEWYTGSLEDLVDRATHFKYIKEE